MFLTFFNPGTGDGQGEAKKGIIYGDGKGAAPDTGSGSDDESDGTGSDDLEDLEEI